MNQISYFLAYRSLTDSQCFYIDSCLQKRLLSNIYSFFLSKSLHKEVSFSFHYLVDTVLHIIRTDWLFGELRTRHLPSTLSSELINHPKIIVNEYYSL